MKAGYGLKQPSVAALAIRLLASGCIGGDAASAAPEAALTTRQEIETVSQSAAQDNTGLWRKVRESYFFSLLLVVLDARFMRGPPQWAAAPAH